MNTVNVPNINFNSDLSNIDGDSNDNAEQVNQFGGNCRTSGAVGI